MVVSENSGFSPQIIHFNRVFHYKPSVLGYHFFSETPILIRRVEKYCKGWSWRPDFFGFWYVRVSVWLTPWGFGWIVWAHGMCFWWESWGGNCWREKVFAARIGFQRLLENLTFYRWWWLVTRDIPLNPGELIGILIGILQSLYNCLVFLPLNNPTNWGELTYCTRLEVSQVWPFWENRTVLRFEIGSCVGNLTSRRKPRRYTWLWYV